MAVLIVMMMAYKTTNGTDMYDPITKEKNTSWLTSYVDNNAIVQCFSRNTSMMHILTEMSANLNEWLKPLQITGGDPSLGKCKISVLM